MRRYVKKQLISVAGLAQIIIKELKSARVRVTSQANWITTTFIIS